MKWSEYVGYPYNLYFRLAGLIFFFFFFSFRNSKGVERFEFFSVSLCSPYNTFKTIIYFNVLKLFCGSGIGEFQLIIAEMEYFKSLKQGLNHVLFSALSH